MSDSTSGACCICGTETTQRCSPCSEKGFDLFFCSREHQKLVCCLPFSTSTELIPVLSQVWFAHKRVCAVVPFQQPFLTREEAMQAKIDLRQALVNGDTVRSSAESFKLQVLGCRTKRSLEASLSLF
jgi:hypothetical protein